MLLSADLTQMSPSEYKTTRIPNTTEMTWQVESEFVRVRRQTMSFVIVEVMYLRLLLVCQMSTGTHSLD